MKTFILFGVLVFTLCIENNLGQTGSEKNKAIPNLTGTWILKYVSIESFGPFGTSGISINNFKSPNCTTEVVIEQNELIIKLKRTETCKIKAKSSSVEIRESKFEYFSDERGETNTLDSNKIDTVTKWDKNVLLIQQKSSETGDRTMRKIKYKLSKDKTKLEQEITITEKNGSKTVTENRYELKIS
jgi:hypothetical protein